MALAIQLMNADYLLSLTDSTVYGIADGGGFGTPTVNALFAPVWGGTFDPLVGVDYANRTASFNINIKGTSGDNWIENAQQLERLLMATRRYYGSGGIDGDAAVLSVQLDNWTYPLEFDVLDYRLGYDSLLQRPLKSSSAPVLIGVPVTLILKPFGHPQALTGGIGSALDNGGGVAAANGTASTGAVAGDVATPVRLTFQSAAGDDFRRLFIGKKSRGNTANFLWILQCEEGTHTGYTVAEIAITGVTMAPQVDAGASGGNEELFTATQTETMQAALRWTINDNLRDFYGKYRVFLRVDSSSDMTDIRFQLTYGGTGADISNPATAVDGAGFTAASNDIVDLGIMEIPHRDFPGTLPSFIFQLSVSWNLASNPDALELDCIYLMPVDEGYLDVLLSANASAQDMIVSDSLLPNPQVYIVDSLGDQQGQKLSGVLGLFSVEPYVDNVFYTLVVDDATTPNMSHDLTDQFTIRLEYFQLYALGRV